MEICSRASTNLCHLFSRALPKIFALSPSLLNTVKTTDAAVSGRESPELPVDILMDILALLEIPDLLRAGSVCSSWHAAYTGVRSLGMYRWPQTPCLLYTSESDADDVACLYSLAEKRVYKLTLPEPPIRSRHLIGSSDGWLITADEMSELHMVNPITGEQVGLPSVTTIEQVKPVFDDEGAIQEYEFAHYFGEEDISIHALDELRDSLYVKAFVFTDDYSDGSTIVVLIHNPISQLSFAKAGDCSWTWLPPGARYDDCIYKDGLLFAVTSFGGIDAFDITGPTVTRMVIMDRSKEFRFEHLYLVEAPSGDLLQVWREQDIVVRAAEGGEGDPERESSERFMETRKITLYKVDMLAKELTEVNGLQDHALFLGLSQSCCRSTEECPQLNTNHVYMTDDGVGFTSRKSYRRDIGVFNLENNKAEQIVSPRSWCNWPAPIWITPSLSYVTQD